jgi:thioester reductase-like protein
MACKGGVRYRKTIMPRPGHDAVLLVTGFPSLYARKMVEEVLANEPRAFVHAVVLAKFALEARRVVEALPPEQAARVALLEGDVAAMDLGLSGAEFRRLTREVDRIHHVAHVSYAGVDRATAEASNVAGAAEILEFATAASDLSLLVFHSTAHVAGDRTGVVYEDDLDAGQSFRNVVEETRMRGEQLVRRAMRRLPIAVVRPTAIVGDSRTGEFDRLEGVYLLVLLVVAAPQDIAIPFPGKGEAPLHVVPLDFVVRAAHAIGRDRASAGKTFHLIDPNALSARSVFDLVAQAGGRRASRSTIPANVAKAILRTPGIERFARSPRLFLEQLSCPVRYDAKNADRILRPLDIVCPPFESYADQLVGVVQEHVRARHKRQKDAEAEVDDPLQ